MKWKMTKNHFEEQVPVHLTAEEYAHIQARRKKKAEEEAQRYKICKPDDLNQAQKAARYENLASLALSIWEDLRTQGYSKDAESWCYEAVMETLMNPEDIDNKAFWQAYCNLEK